MSTRHTYTDAVARLRSVIARTLRAVVTVARDDRIPRPVRWIAGVGLLPIPGPVDEIVLLLVAPVLVGFYREPMREAWERASVREGIAAPRAARGRGD
jgi:hypothetical protein